MFLKGICDNEDPLERKQEEPKIDDKLPGFEILSFTLGIK